MTATLASPPRQPQQSPAHDPPAGRPGLRERLGPPMPGDRLFGWLGPLAVALVAGVLRFWHLTQPKGIYFDEVYYTKDAYSLLTKGYELNDTCSAGGFAVHPPLGKWMMAVSEWAFGYTDCAGGRHGNPELGWRFAGALVGTLAVLVLARTARRMFRSTVLGCFAGLLLGLDGLEFVMSRIGILDVFLLFWIVCALGCLVRDRDAGRDRLADRAEATGRDGPGGYGVAGPERRRGTDGLLGTGGPSAAEVVEDDGDDAWVDADGWTDPDSGAPGGARHRPAAVAGSAGPWLGLRPWRLACGICLGAAMAVKWSGLYSIVGFAALAVAWDIGARRSAGVRKPVRAFLRRDVPGWVAAFLVLPVVVYTATWIGWFANTGGYDRTLYGTGVVAVLRGWLKYHQEIRQFHEHLSTPHPYASKPFSWLVLGRPVAFYYSSPAAGTSGCTAAGGCAREVLALGNPAIWWGGTLALVGTAAAWVARRDWRAATVLVGFGSGFLPWLLFPDRTMFVFYALPLLPFLILGLTLLAGYAIGPRTASDNRRVTGALVVGGYAVIVVVLFAYFYPIIAAQVIPTDAWRHRMWFPGWI